MSGDGGEMPTTAKGGTMRPPRLKEPAGRQRRRSSLEETLPMASAVARPLIVCGMGRSGTRMCANILNNSSLVELQGEIGGPAGTRLVTWLEAARLQRRNDNHAETYNLARAAFRLGNRGDGRERPGVLWFGHKTPRHERHFRRYEVIFDDPDNRPIYVYCFRNPFDVWRSYRAMPWNKFRTVEDFLKAWLRSVRMYEIMAEAAPGRVIVFNLDEMLRAGDWSAYLTPRLFEPLQIPASSFSRPVQKLSNSNSALNKTGARPEPISDADRLVIAGHPEARRVIARHFPWIDTGYAPVRGADISALPGRRTWQRFRRACIRAWKGARREWRRSQRA